MTLIAIIRQINQIIETMWGDPNRWADEQRRIYKLSLSLSDRDRAAGYSLERLDLYEKAVWIGQDSLEPADAYPLGITEGSIIVIAGPVYRADTFAFRIQELTEEPQAIYAVPFRGHSIPKTVPLEDYDGSRKIDRRKHLPRVSIKTARHAIGYLPEDPISLLSSDTEDPLAPAILRTLAGEGPAAVRASYFTEPIARSEDRGAASAPQERRATQPSRRAAPATTAAPSPPIGPTRAAEKQANRPYEPSVPRGREVARSPYFALMEDDDGVGFVHCGDAVLVVPVTKDEEVLMALERSPALDRDVLGLVSGDVDEGESLEAAADRELQEELGWRAGRLDFLGELHPFKYLTSRQFAFLARDLTRSKLEGDERYPVRVRKVPLARVLSLCTTGELHDALAISALSLAQVFLAAEAT
jgi:ADP-ribose diphosphatase